MLAAFNDATGQKPGVKEVVLQMDDFFDYSGLGDWSVTSYGMTSLPGYQDSSSVRLLSVTVDILQPETSAATLPSVSVRNWMVLSGVLGFEGTLGASPVLLAGKQTLLTPSNAPAWRRVADIKLDALLRQGYNLSSTGTTGVEVVRVAFLDPDIGSAATSLAMQARLRLRYAVSFPLSDTVLVMQSKIGSPTTPGSGTYVQTSVFPSVQSMQARQ